MEWVFLEKVYEATKEEVATYLKRMKSIYPDNRIRACDSESGKIIDLI
jgi:hypothetical protein